MKQLVILFTLLALSLVQPANAMYSDSIYSTYNQIENAVLSDPKLVFKLREVFHPVTTERRWQVDGVQVIPILLCINFNPAREADICGTNKTLSPNTEYCKWFQWTNSYLLNLISPELLLTMDPVVYSVIYSEIVRSVHSPFNLVQLTDIEVNLSCVPSFDDFLSASALFLSWVINPIHCNTYSACMNDLANILAALHLIHTIILSYSHSFYAFIIPLSPSLPLSLFPLPSLCHPPPLLSVE